MITKYLSLYHLQWHAYLLSYCCGSPHRGQGGQGLVPGGSVLAKLTVYFFQSLVLGLGDVIIDEEERHDAHHKVKPEHGG